MNEALYSGKHYPCRDALTVFLKIVIIYSIHLTKVIFYLPDVKFKVWSIYALHVEFFEFDHSSKAYIL